MGIRTTIVLICCILFTSCFEIIEEITLNEDGSGSFELTLNLSESKTKLSSVMLLDSVDGFEIPSRHEITNTILDLVEQTQMTAGIDHVQHQLDFENFIFNISCDFTNIEALNVVVKNLGNLYGMDKSISPNEVHVSYIPETKTFIRNGNYNTSKEYEKMDARGKEILNEARYISINRFSSEIENAQNTQTKISPNKKATMLKLTISDVLSGRVSIGNELKLK